MRLAGLLLAAGAGRRMGLPKALLRDVHDVPFLDRAVGRLLDGGCDEVLVVLGASADEARALLDEAGWSEDPAVTIVEAGDWVEGIGASLRAGLTALVASDAEAALVSLVDLPDVDATVIRRVSEAGPAGTRALLRATYHGQPGHPVLIGREHWAGIVATARADQGAREYLRMHPPAECECGDLAGGRDVDHPDYL
jgi:molybdenum cofactor cytidylyltransferase/nicotine blue oxidoreductase